MSDELGNEGDPEPGPGVSGMLQTAPGDQAPAHRELAAGRESSGGVVEDAPTGDLKSSPEPADEPEQAESANDRSTTDAELRARRRIPFPAGVLSGYLFGVAGFYTNFFGNILQATGILFDVLALLVAGTVWARFSDAGGLRTFARAPWIAGGLAFLAVVVAVNYVAFNPPNITQVAGVSETCVYNVLSTPGTPIPLEPGGSVTQQFQPHSTKISTISVIIGLDKASAHLGRRHPIQLNVWSTDGLVNERRSVPNVFNNTFTPVAFHDPLELKNDKETLKMQVVNQSDEPISVYIKQPGDTELALGTGEGAVIRGHVGQEDEYVFKGFAMSGCVARPD